MPSYPNTRVPLVISVIPSFRYWRGGERDVGRIRLFAEEEGIFGRTTSSRGDCSDCSVEGGGKDKGLRMFIIEGLAINLEGVSRVESGTEIFVTVCLLFCLKMIFKYIRQRVLREMNCQNCFKRNREIPSTIINVCLNAYTETNFLQF